MIQMNQSMRTRKKRRMEYLVHLLGLLLQALWEDVVLMVDPEGVCEPLLLAQLSQTTCLYEKYWKDARGDRNDVVLLLPLITILTRAVPFPKQKITKRMLRHWTHRLKTLQPNRHTRKAKILVTNRQSWQPLLFPSL
jgi:hypothetical protein